MNKHNLGKVELKPSIILLSASIILVIFKYYGYPQSFVSIFHTACGVDFKNCFPAHIYFFLCSVLLLILVPFILIKFVLKEKVSDYGLKKGDSKFGMTSFLILFPLIALVMILPSSGMPQFKAEYPLFALAGKAFSLVLLYELMYGLYYISWEFFFRGYLLFGLKDIFGEWNAILIQTLPSVLMHIGKPDGEILASIAAGILFGKLALRGKSIYYVFLLHWFIGMAMDLFILYL
ncbi:MAG: CPBP family intramembrane metalloprotease [candidate division Zixibacteria bacterium]|nr:CPBP family intramembrane metalloprotease [candidate division Zixibacteria bacterium]